MERILKRNVLGHKGFDLGRGERIMLDGLCVALACGCVRIRPRPETHLSQPVQLSSSAGLKRHRKRDQTQELVIS